MIKSAFLFSFLFVNVWARSCVHEWRSYNGTCEVLVNGVFVGNFTAGIPSFIGRGFYEDALVTGRIQITAPTGLYHIFKGTIRYIVNGVEYLARNPNYDYKWIQSGNGDYVDDAIAPGYTPGREVHFVGRIQIDGRTYYGKMLPNVGMYYEDANQKEILAKKYEIIVCNVAVK